MQIKKEYKKVCQVKYIYMCKIVKLIWWIYGMSLYVFICGRFQEQAAQLEHLIRLILLKPPVNPT